MSGVFPLINSDDFIGSRRNNNEEVVELVGSQSVGDDRDANSNEDGVVSSEDGALSDGDFLQVGKSQDTVKSVENVSSGTGGALSGADTLSTFSWALLALTVGSSVGTRGTRVRGDTSVAAESLSITTGGTVRLSELTLGAGESTSGTCSSLSVVEFARWAGLSG